MNERITDYYRSVIQYIYLVVFLLICTLSRYYALNPNNVKNKFVQNVPVILEIPV